MISYQRGKEPIESKSWKVIGKRCMYVLHADQSKTGDCNWRLSVGADWTKSAMDFCGHSAAQCFTKLLSAKQKHVVPHVRFLAFLLLLRHFLSLIWLSSHFLIAAQRKLIGLTDRLNRSHNWSDMLGKISQLNLTRHTDTITELNLLHLGKFDLFWVLRHNI